MKACVCLMVFSTAASAAPVLRIGPNSVVTAHVAVGATGTSQTLLAGNIGDGVLSLSVAITPAITWLAVSVLPLVVCPAYFDGTCNAIQFTFKSAGLAAGSYSARVTVSDPNAVDSPQVVIVTLFVGDPQAIEKYVAPGTTTDIPFPSSTFTGCSWCPLEVSTANGAGGCQ
jgi:hypothetical protein